MAHLMEVSLLLSCHLQFKSLSMRLVGLAAIEVPKFGGLLLRVERAENGEHLTIRHLSSPPNAGNAELRPFRLCVLTSSTPFQSCSGTSVSLRFGSSGESSSEVARLLSREPA